MSRQTTNTVLMIEPLSFGLNPESVEDNFFQPRTEDGTSSAAAAAITEYHAACTALSEANISVISIAPPTSPFTPDAVFPNNWFSTHEGGILCLYPMRHPNRRLERRPEIITELNKRYSHTIDFTGFETKGLYLESTGSMVLDRINRLCYAALSQRTSPSLVTAWCREFNYTPVTFDAADNDGHAIYHTNVFMSVGEKFAVFCPEAIRNKRDREKTLGLLQDTGKTIIEVTLPQVFSYCGNCLELNSPNGSVLALSVCAWNGLTKPQQELISGFSSVVSTPVDTIERLGGGSLRCMLAELF